MLTMDTAPYTTQQAPVPLNASPSTIEISTSTCLSAAEYFALNQPFTNQTCNRILCSTNDDDEHAKNVSGDEIIGELEVNLWRVKLC